MDTEALKLVLNQLQASNQAFLASMAKENREFIEKAIRDGKVGGERQAAIPNFRCFNKSTDKWSTYLLQLEQHFLANAVTEEPTRRACILSWIGADNLELLQKLFDGKVKDKTFKEITSKLNEHFIEKQHVLAARFKFYHTTMKSGQLYSDWVAELRGASKDCMFMCCKDQCGESYVDSKIRDMIVMHTPHEKVRTAALQKTNPSLEEVIQIASVYESTVKTCSEMKESETTTVNNVYKSTLSKGKIGVKQNKKSQSRGPSKGALKSCPSCGISHVRSDCIHFKKKTKCNICSIPGHISSVCKSAENRKTSALAENRKTSAKNHVNLVRDIAPTTFENISVIDAVYTLENAANKKIDVNIRVNGTLLKFQVDTGASCSLVGTEGYKMLGEPKCEPTDKVLKAYGGQILPLKGVAMVSVCCGSVDEVLPLVVVENNTASNIIGLDWFSKLKLRVDIPTHLEPNECHSSSTVQSPSGKLSASLANMTKEFPFLFTDELGLCTTFKADVVLKPDGRPKFCKPYNLPFAYYDEVRNELSRLVSTNVLKPINASEWAAPIVIVRKPNNKIRICADFKVGLNSQIQIDRYPIPRIEELLYKLQGGEQFTKVDLSEAYHQIELSETAKKYMVINTPFGLYQYQRLPFGVASAPGIFQRFMEQLIAGIPGCAVYLDDVIITGGSDEDHLANVRLIFQRLENNGLRCRQEKCTFAAPQIEYVGHIIDSKGIRPSPKRLEAIQLMPRPKNLRELEAFIGKINYYNKFIPNFSSKASTLNILRRQGQEFSWGDQQEKAFLTLKNDIIQAAQLVHHNEKLPIILATDASKYGIGAVISHRYPNGSEKPIAFASKTLNKSQEHYSQIEKEALSIVFGVTRFHQYLYGRHFELTSDHQPLTTIFNPNKRLPVATLHRLQRWAIFLQAYDYTIRYKSTAQHANADALSRLPVGEDLEFDRWENNMLDGQINEVEMDVFPISSAVVAEETAKDSTLNTIKEMIRDGWPDHLPKSKANIKPFFDRRFSLSLQKDVVVLHREYHRVVVPTTLQQKVLTMLHDGHWGQTRMKQMSRRYVWFPKIDEAIEAICKNCSVCANAASNPKRTFSSWPAPTKPWERIHVDFAGPFFGSMWLIVIDAHSKFPYTIEISTSTSTVTISALQKIFAIEGLPQTIVSDNGPQFTSWEFRKFCELNAIEHLTTAPFHPASNGLAERFVRTFKEVFAKEMKGSSSKEKALCKYLATYRATPNPLTGKSPAEILHGRQPRTLLSALFPEAHINKASKPKFSIGQEVQVRNFSGKNKWIVGIIKQTLGRMMYRVATDKGLLRRHQNQIKIATGSTAVKPITDDSDWDVEPSNMDIPNANPSAATTGSPSTTPLQSNIPVSIPSEPPVRRSERPRKQPVRFQIPRK